MSQEKQDQVLDHDYDGIQEYDNRLPTWWLAILYGTVVFAFGYWIWYHTLGAGPTPDERYQAELVAAAEAELARMEGQELTNEVLNTMSTIPDQVAVGKGVFEQFCVVCHADQGQGSVGPNLTDDYWLHGGLPLDIHRTVTNGVPDKGMVAWGNQLGPSRVRSVVAYILTLRGTNVPGKEPQGEQTGPGGAPLNMEGEAPVTPEGDAPATPEGETPATPQGEAPAPSDEG